MIHINSLPSEVLAHIFELGTASPENDFGQENFPSLVSLVCQSWRTLALDTPTLWNNLTLDSKELPPFTKTRTYITRSKGTPLNVYLDFSSRAQPDLVKAVLDVILPEIARWRHLIIVVPNFDIMYSAVEMIGDAFKPYKTMAPNLEVLRLYGPPEFDPTQPEPRDLPPPISIFGPTHVDPDDEDEFDPTPRLRDVVFCGIPVNWGTFLPSNLEQLQLSLHSGSRQPTFTQFARLVTGSPKLHTLILNASGPTILPHGHTEPLRVDLPYLKSLTLDCFDPEYVERLLARVCTPSLDELSLADASGDSSRVFEMLAIGRGSNTDAVGRSVGVGAHNWAAQASTLSMVAGSTLSLNGYLGSTFSVVGAGSSASIDSTSSASSTAAFPRLTTLKISSVECTPAAFRQLVRGLPNLTNVKLDARDADPEVLCTLAETESDNESEIDPEDMVPPRPTFHPTFPNMRGSALERICPRLQTISCTGVPGRVIREFVARRIKARVPIRKVRVCVASSGDGDEENPEPAVEGGHWLSAEDREWLERHVELEFFDEDEEEDIDGGAWWSTWD
ncbi:F-box-like protein [Rhizoctonia solani]|uniref:F-box-like protein n=1 Tax=Rhizoctonia solani TaxID=456999 RepID=A0A8H8P6G6_9AGAM|nr:F-box-like protein [Rhizoctonia solani]QRW25207.1 F-box-like protein [Rhizoctonia solani]